MTEIKTIVYFILHFGIIALLLRSMFFLYKARRKMPRKDLWFLLVPIVSGIGYLSYNSTNLDMVTHRFPFMMLFLAGAANAFYMLSKSRKETAFSIHNLIIEEYSGLQEKVLSKLKNKDLVNSEGVDKEDIPDVPFNHLNSFEVNRLFIPDKKGKKEALKKKPLPPTFISTIKFYAYLLKNGIFTIQTHSDADEHLYIEKGMVEEICSGKLFKEGDYVFIPAGTPHGLRGLAEFNSVSAYLVKVNPIL